VVRASLVGSREPHRARRSDRGHTADVQAASGSLLNPEQVLPHLRGLGFSEADAATLADHFLDAERRQKRGHGLVRLENLAERHRFDPGARPERVVAEPEFERWQGRNVLGYLMLAAICDAQLANPPRRSRLVVAAPCFPTGVLGYWTRRLAEGGLVAVLTATSPRRLGHPDGGPPLAGTNPVSIAVPSSDGRPLVADVSMGRVTYGDVLAGAATEDDLEPFGGEHAHKAFALAVGLQSLVDALAGPDEYGTALLVARPEFDPVPALRARSAGVRLPGDQ
jgi:LDH2 family malate/lactate/ureidoglycolate dehydrogenase